MTDQNPFIHALKLLEDAEVDYVVVGGFAVVMHGCNRFTPDLNVMVSFENNQLARIAERLISSGFVATTDADHTRLYSGSDREQLFDKGKRWFFSFRHLDNPSFCVDVFLHFPVPFQQVFSRKHRMSSSFCDFSICSIEDLISMKSIAGRGQDKADIGAMSMIRSLQQKLSDGKQESDIYTAEMSEAEREQLEGLYRFASLSVDEKLDWLEQMLNHLGKFCVV